MGAVVVPLVAPALAGTLGGAVLSLGINLALASVTSKFFGQDQKPGQGPSYSDPGVETRVRTDTKNKLPIIYGQTQVSGSTTYVFFEPRGSGGSDDRMHFIISLGEGPIQSIDEIVWEDKRLTLSAGADGTVRSVTNARDFNGDSHSFLNGNVAFALFPRGGRCTPMENVATGEWGDSNRIYRTMPNVAYVYVRLDYNRDDGVTGLPSNLKFTVRGQRVRTFNVSGLTTRQQIDDLTDSQLAARYLSTVSYSNNPADCLADFLLNDRYGIGNTLDTDDIDIRSFLKYKLFCDSIPTNQTDADGDADNSTVRFAFNGHLNTNDDRDTLLGDLTLSSGATLMISLGKFGVGLDTTADVDTDTQWIRRIVPNPNTTIAATSPTIREEDLYGDVSITNSGMNNLVNRVTGRYRSPGEEMQYVEEQVFVNAAADTRNPFEPDLPKEFDLRMVNNSIQANRICATALNKTRETQVVDIKVDYRYLHLQPRDVISLEYSPYGIEQDGSNTNTGHNGGKLYEIQEIGDAELQGEPSGIGGLSIKLKEFNNNVFMDRAIRAAQLAPNTSFRGSIQPTNVANFTVTEEQYEANVSGAIKIRLRFSWDAVPLATSYDLEYRYIETDALDVLTDTDQAWQPIGTPVTSTEYLLNEVRTADVFGPNSNTRVKYECRIRARGITNQPSPQWQAYKDRAADTDENIIDGAIRILGLSAPPRDITGFTIVSDPGNGTLNLAWDISPDLDVRAGSGFYRIYHTSETDPNLARIFNAQTEIDRISGSATTATVFDRAGIYMIVAYDTYGNRSVNPAIIVRSQAGSAIGNLLASFPQHFAFTDANADRRPDTNATRNIVPWRGIRQNMREEFVPDNSWTDTEIVFAASTSARRNFDTTHLIDNVTVTRGSAVLTDTDYEVDGGRVRLNTATTEQVRLNITDVYSNSELCIQNKSNPGIYYLTFEDSDVTFDDIDSENPEITVDGSVDGLRFFLDELGGVSTFDLGQTDTLTVAFQHTVSAFNDRNIGSFDDVLSITRFTGFDNTTFFSSSIRTTLDDPEANKLIYQHDTGTGYDRGDTLDISVSEFNASAISTTVADSIVRSMAETSFNTVRFFEDTEEVLSVSTDSETKTLNAAIRTVDSDGNANLSRSKVIFSVNVPEWNNSTNYAVGAIVQRNDLVYRALRSNSGRSPNMAVGTDWDTEGTYSAYNTITITHSAGDIRPNVTGNTITFSRMRGYTNLDSDSENEGTLLDSSVFGDWFPFSIGAIRFRALQARATLSSEADSEDISGCFNTLNLNVYAPLRSYSGSGRTNSAIPVYRFNNPDTEGNVLIADMRSTEPTHTINPDYIRVTDTDGVPVDLRNYSIRIDTDTDGGNRRVYITPTGSATKISPANHRVYETIMTRNMLRSTTGMLDTDAAGVARRANGYALITFPEPGFSAGISGYNAVPNIIRSFNDITQNHLINVSGQNNNNFEVVIIDSGDNLGDDTDFTWQANGAYQLEE